MLKFMGFLCCFVAAVVIIAIAATPKVFIWSARTTSTVMVGNSATITCRVAQNDNNRGLFLGVRGYASSYHQLDGERAPITHRAEFHKVPCEAEATFCELVDAYENRITVAQPLIVAGCDGH